MAADTSPVMQRFSGEVDFDAGDIKVQHFGLLMKKPFGHKSTRWQKRYFACLHNVAWGKLQAIVLVGLWQRPNCDNLCGHSAKLHVCCACAASIYRNGCLLARSLLAGAIVQAGRQGMMKHHGMFAMKPLDFVL